MFGGFLPYVWVYNWVAAVTIFSWIIFGRCIASDGYNYSKGAVSEEVLGDGGLELFKQSLLVSLIFTAVRLQNPMSLVLYAIYKLKEMSA